MTDTLDVPALRAMLEAGPDTERPPAEVVAVDITDDATPAPATPRSN